MVEVLGAIASISEIIKISSTVVTFIKAAKDAKSDRQKLLAEINATTTLCQTLKDSFEIDDGPWQDTFKALEQGNSGPLEQFKASLQFLQRKLDSGERSHLKLLGQALKWPFDRKGFQDVLADIERQKSLINLALTKDNQKLIKAIHDGVSSSERGIEILRSGQKKQERQDLLARLNSINFEASHLDIAARRAPQTGQWLLHKPEFKSWEQSDTGKNLWCTGIPGAGKTVLASLVIDHLRAMTAGDSLKSVAGIYCSYQDPQSTMKLLRSLIQQLLAFISDIPHWCHSISDENINSTGDLKAILARVLSLHKDVYIIIDALDECPYRKDLLTQLFDASSKASSRVHIAITARPGIDSHGYDLTADVDIEISSSEEDVRRYLQQSLREHEQLSAWIERSAEFEDNIINAIIPRVSGMFLLARLYVDLLSQKTTQRDVRRALQTLPESRNETYENAWERIGKLADHGALGRKILMWVVCATRPLKLAELLEGLAIDEGDEELDPEGMPDPRRLPMHCAGLVIFNKETNTLGLVHPTAHEFFMDRKLEFFPNGDEALAVSCTTYLLMRPFRTQGWVYEWTQVRKRYDQHHLLRYAATTWGVHARRACSDIVEQLSLQLLLSQQSKMASFQAVMSDKEHTLYHRLGPQHPGTDFAWLKDRSSAIHLAAYFGLGVILEKLLKERDEIELDILGGMPVHWAIFGGQTITLKILLEHGANPNAERVARLYRNHISLYEHPLHIAACFGHAAAVELLLEHGADINAMDQDKRGNKVSAVTAALFPAHRHIAHLLLLRGFNHNLLDKRAVQVIIRYGTIEILQTILQAGCSESVKQQALQESAEGCMSEMLAVLIEAGISNDGDGEVSVERTTEHSIAMLDESGVGTLPEDAALSLVIRNARRHRAEALQCVLLIVSGNADVNLVSATNYMRDVDDWPRIPKLGTTSGRLLSTPMIAAAYQGQTEIISTLVEHGAKINFDVGKGHTALSATVRLEQRLVDLGGDSREWRGHPTLEVKPTIDCLMSLGADPSLCTPADRARIEQLAKLSDMDCEMLLVIFEFTWRNEDLELRGYDLWSQEHSTRPGRGFRELQKEVKRLSLLGASPENYLTAWKVVVEEITSWSDQELDVFDQRRQACIQCRGSESYVPFDV